MSSQRRSRPDETGRAGLTRATQSVRTSPASAIPSSYDRKEVVQALDGLVTVISEDEVILNTLADGVTELLKHRDSRGVPSGGHEARLAVITQVIDKVFLDDSILQLVGTQLSRELKGTKRKAAKDPSEPKDASANHTASDLPMTADRDPAAPVDLPLREADPPAPQPLVEPSLPCPNEVPAVQEEEEEEEEEVGSVASTVEQPSIATEEEGEEPPRDPVQGPSVKAAEGEQVTGAGRVEQRTRDDDGPITIKEGHARGWPLEGVGGQEGGKEGEEEEREELVFVTPKTHEDPTPPPIIEGPPSEARRMEEITSEDEDDLDDGSTISNVSSNDSEDNEEEEGLAPGESVFSRGFNPGELVGPNGPGFSSRGAQAQGNGNGAAVVARRRLAPLLGLGDRSDSLVDLGAVEGGEEEGMNLSNSGGSGGEGGGRQREEVLDTSLGHSSGSGKSGGSGRSGASSASGRSLGTDEEGGGRRGGAAMRGGNRRRGGGGNGDGAHHRRCTSSVSSVLTIDSLQDLMMDLLPPNAEDSSQAHQFAPHALLSPSRFRPVLATLHSMDVPSEEDDSGSDVQTVGVEKGGKKGSCLGQRQGQGEGGGGEEGEFFDASDEMDKEKEKEREKEKEKDREEEEEEEFEEEEVVEVEDEYEDDYDEYEESEDPSLLGKEREREHRLPSPKPWDRVQSRVRFVPRVVTAVHYIEPYAPEDLHLLFYSEREIRLFEMEAEGPLPSSEDEEDEDGGARGRKLSSHITSGGARVETVVFDDAASDDFWA